MKNDFNIIEGCRRKQAKSQRALFDRYSEMLFSISLRYVSSEPDAKDVLQESFLRIFKHFEKFDPQKGSLKNWMIQICIREALKRLSQKKEIIELDTIKEQPQTEPIILSHLQMEDLMKVIRQLPLPYRTILNLFLIEGYSHKEIGQLLGIKESSSRSGLTRAKMMLRKTLTNKKKHESWI